LSDLTPQIPWEEVRLKLIEREKAARDHLKKT
jgi:hypothetical protein